MMLKLLLWMQLASVCDSLSSLASCSMSHNVENNGMIVDCRGRGLSEIPTDLPVNTTSLDLSNNLISSVTNHSFLGVPRLQNLDLSNNFISNIEPLAFWNCESLKNLSIYFNRVCVNGSVFENLGTLQKLTIDECYAGEVFKPLSGVTTIVMVAGNCIYSFEGFQYLYGLRNLVIDGCFKCQNDTFAKLENANIRSLSIIALLLHMEKNALAPLKQLQELVFSNTRTGLSRPLDALYGLAGRNLTTLVMENVINHVGSQHLKDVEDRTLTKERLLYLSQICVHKVSLNKNLILFLDMEFIEKSVIGKCLIRLDVRQNIITKFPVQVLLQLWKLRQLEYIDASDQAHLPVIPSPKPDQLTLSEVSIWEPFHEKGGVVITIPKFLLELLLRRVSRNMDKMDFDITFRGGNRIKKIDFSFNGISSLKHLYGVPNLEYVDLSGNERLLLPDDFFCTFKHIETLKMTDMSFRQNVINSQAHGFLKCLTQIKTLDISGNRLVQLPSHLFDVNPSLEYLDLSRNVFITIPVHLSLLPNLHLLDVSSNSFGSLDKETTDDIDSHYENTRNLFQLHLKGNFFECSCTNFPFLSWLSGTNSLADTNGNLTCITENGNITKTGEITLNMLKFWRKCKGSETFSSGAVLGTLLLCGILLALLVDTNKTKLAYFLINALKHQVPKRRRKHFQRDVYVSYADVDYRWACLELCAILEERNLNLFIWDRDAIPGDCTPEVITENVNQCWKTILFFTENYERDAWSYLTTMAAVNCVDNLNPERLILLLPENENPRVPECLLQVVPESCIFYVPKVIRRNDAFWDDLEKALKKET